MKQILQKLADLANEFDTKGLPDAANQIDDIIRFAAEEDWENSKFEGTNMTIKEINDILDRFNALDDPHEVNVSVISKEGPELISLEFPVGPTATVTGEVWDKIQIMLGIM
jgi:hypothetical protein